MSTKNGYYTETTTVTTASGTVIVKNLTPILTPKERERRRREIERGLYDVLRKYIPENLMG